MNIRCDRCGKKFEKSKTSICRVAGASGGAVAGAVLGSNIAVTLGPLGVVGGAIPLAVLGVVLGQGAGRMAAHAKCPRCAKLNLFD